MENKSIYLKEQNHNLPNRRDFLIKGSLGAAGLAMFPSHLIKATTPPDWNSFFLGMLGQLSKYVGFWLERKSAERYYGYRGAPMYQYTQPQNWGYNYQPYSGYYWSSRYSNSYSLNNEKTSSIQGMAHSFNNENQEGSLANLKSRSIKKNNLLYAPNYIIYPWSYGNFDGIVTFQNLIQGQLYANYLAGPTIWALRYFSQEVFRKGIVSSEKELCDMILPNCESQNGISRGRFGQTYGEPDIYKSNYGTIKVDNEANSSNSGEVSITYIRDKNNNLAPSSQSFEFGYKI